MVVSAPLAPSIGRYPILATAHEGSHSVVYRCRDQGLAREVAVKALRPDGAERADAGRRLGREARVRGAIQHPHVLPLFRAARSRGGLLLVGPWLPGGTLAERWMAPLPPASVAALAVELGAALDALHAAGWTHGDLNASNVLFDGEGRSLLADFGSARRIGARVRATGGRRTLTTTPHTCAPEVWTGRPVDGRADIYGLAVLLYRTFTGSYPFDADEPAAFGALHIDGAIPPPSARSAAAGPATDRVFARALAKAPAHRFESGAELAGALTAALRDDGLLSDVGPASTAAEPTGGSTPLPFSEDAIERTTVALERFEAELSERERLALWMLLERARIADAVAVGGMVDITRQVFGPPAALLALEDCGAAEALAAGPLTAQETAAACGVPLNTLGRVMEALAAAGLLGREEEDRYHLPPPLATIYRSYRRVGATARPVRDQFNEWSYLTRWTTTAQPNYYSDRKDGSVYQRVVGVLGTLYTGAAKELAAALRKSGRVPTGARVLDVGAGSAVWSIAFAAADPSVRIAALDRPVVLEMTRSYAETSGVADRLECIGGDWRDAPLPPGGFDLAILANICHLEPEEQNRYMLRRTFDAVRPGGRVVVVDTMPEHRREATLDALLQGLDIALRTPGGGIYDREAYGGWLEDAGYEVEEFIPLHDPTGRLRGLVARRPE